MQAKLLESLPIKFGWFGSNSTHCIFYKQKPFAHIFDPIKLIGTHLFKKFILPMAKLFDFYRIVQAP